MEKFPEATRACASARQKKALRCFAQLLRAIMADRTRELGVQSRHRVANDLGDARDILAQLLSAQRCNAVAFLAEFGGGEWLIEFFRDGRRDGNASDRDAPR